MAILGKNDNVVCVAEKMRVSGRGCQHNHTLTRDIANGCFPSPPGELRDHSKGGWPEVIQVIVHGVPVAGGREACRPEVSHAEWRLLGKQAAAAEDSRLASVLDQAASIQLQCIVKP